VPLLPDQAVLLADSLVPTVENEFQITHKILLAIPADQGDYKPDEFSMTAFALAWHMASSETRFLAGVAGGEFTFEAYEKPETLSGIAEFHAAHFAKNIAAIKAKTGEELAKVMDFRGMFQLPAVMFLMFNNNHIIHHRGQLSTYLRPMGGKVPAIYGESYDSKAAKQALQPA
jgi:uncharacterized damage-inducible protein DinB